MIDTSKLNDADLQYIRWDDRIQVVPIDEVIPYANNARVHDERSLNVLCNNIKKFKFSIENAISVDKDMVIICGHGRLLAAQRIGLSVIPYEMRDDLSPEDVKLKRNSDNMAQDLSLFNNDKLWEDLSGLEESYDLGDFGFEVPSFDEPAEDEPEIMEEPEGDGGDCENFNTIVYIDNQDDYDLLQAFLLQNDLTGKRMN